MSDDLFGNLILPPMAMCATLSPCGRYRYLLSRKWDTSLPMLTWCMLNPSVADSEQDDPTIRRVVNYSRAWGYGGCQVVNLFGLRATNPNSLHDVDDPVGPDNDQAIIDAAGNGIIVAAWGTGGTYLDREATVMKLLRERGCNVVCLGVSKYGRPLHPLYQRADLQPVPYPSVAPLPAAPVGDEGRANP